MIYKKMWWSEYKVATNDEGGRYSEDILDEFENDINNKVNNFLTKEGIVIEFWEREVKQVVKDEDYEKDKDYYIDAMCLEHVSVSYTYEGVIVRTEEQIDRERRQKEREAKRVELIFSNDKSDDISLDLPF